ncbi:protein of unknown function [Magnetospirillum sp. XM-1]|nr:protein of unknown function [Magnetospirillum sp. XM-1]
MELALAAARRRQSGRLSKTVFTCGAHRMLTVNRQSLNEMSEFLRMWLFNHIMKFDMNYRDWVCPKGN